MIAMLAGLFVKTGIPTKFAGILAWAAIIIVAGFAIWLALDSYGDARYDAGVKDTDAKWEEASKKLEREAVKSATKADDKAAQRLEVFEEQVAREKEQIDDATRKGDSPLDVLFGSGEPANSVR